jgi:uncharacterized protein (TIGR04255 family)
LIQLQRDRFLCNWRKLSASHAYPRYDNVVSAFFDHFQHFESFASTIREGRISPTQYELTYVNHIPSDAGLWQDVRDWPNVTTILASPKDGYLPPPVSSSFAMTYDMPDRMGRLHVRVHSAQQVEDGSGLMVFELTARGIAASAKQWFDTAHEWIVRGFEQLTTEHAHRLWERTNDL